LITIQAVALNPLALGFVPFGVESSVIVGSKSRTIG
jgi:hypothetical protein